MAGIRSRALLFMLLIITAAASRQALAVPAAPFLHQLRQPDGSTFAARQWGDEFRAGWETGDGYTVLLDPQTSAWYYAEIDAGGELADSRRRVGRDAPHGLAKRARPARGNGLNRRLRPLPATPAATAGVVGATASPAAPALITRNIPVILINFSDTTPTYTTADFSTLLFGSGSWSFREYYEEVSGGAFSVGPGSSEVQGWYTAANPHDYYGQPSGWGPPDKWPGELAYEAVLNADATIDFSEFDHDGNCLVDVVAIIHQGPAQEASGVSTDIWSQSWSISTTFGYGLSGHGSYTTNDICHSDPGRHMVVDNYIMMPETLPANIDPGITTIGVFAHEYGHALGLIDLYDTGRPANSEAIGNWSLMASGSWGRVLRAGDRPSHLDPWSKRRLGWLAPTLITVDQAGATLPAVEESGQVWQFLPGSPDTGGEYFLAENRRQTGFDAALPGAGMLLWHIDESRSGNSYEWYPGCSSCPSHYKVALVQADGRFDLERNLNRGDGGDPFPGTSVNRSLSHLTSPASRLYNGDPAGFSLGNISDAAETMTADITLADGIAPVTTITAAPPLLSNSSSAVFSFSAGPGDSFDCRLDGGSYLPCSSPHAINGLAEGGHSFTVRGVNPSGTFDPAPPSHAWTVDTLPPETTLLSAPPPLTAELAGSFSFSAGEPGSSFACSLDGSDWSACTSPTDVAGLSEGVHSFAVRASDPAGNTDPTPDAWTWRVARNVKLSLPDQPDSYHVTPGAALTAVPDGGSAQILARNVEISGDLVMKERCVEITLLGGHAPGFTTIDGRTTVVGSVTVSCGSLAVQGIAIRKN